MTKSNHILKHILCLIVILTFCIQGCKKPSAKSLNMINSNKPDFNPDYFRADSSFHHVIKVLYLGGDYSLAYPDIMKLPGRYKKLNSPGDLTFYYRNVSRTVIDTLVTSFPHRFIRDVKDSSLQVVSFDSVVFLLPLPDNNQIKSVVFFNKSLLVDSLEIPKDTFDILLKNKTAALDSSVFN